MRCDQQHDQPSGDRRSRRRAAALAVAGAFALALLVGAPWLSASATASTYEPCDWESSEPSSPGSLCSSSSGGFYSESDPPCEISAGSYPFPASGTLDWSLPSWVEPLGGSVCVRLDGSALGAVEPEPTPVVVDNWPSDSPGSASLLSAVEGWRDLYLYSVGILIFLGAAMVTRGRV